MKTAQSTSKPNSFPWTTARTMETPILSLTCKIVRGTMFVPSRCRKDPNNNPPSLRVITNL